MARALPRPLAGGLLGAGGLQAPGDQDWAGMGGAGRAPAGRGSGTAWRQVVCRPLWRGATEADVRAVFERAGYAVARVRLRENVQRQPKNSAVVEFRDEQVAWEAFQRPPAGQGGVTLRVEIKAHHNNRKKLATQNAGGCPHERSGERVSHRPSAAEEVIDRQADGKALDSRAVQGGAWGGTGGRSAGMATLESPPAGSRGLKRAAGAGWAATTPRENPLQRGRQRPRQAQFLGESAPRPAQMGDAPASHALESDKKLAEVQERYVEAMLRLGKAEVNAKAAQRGEIKKEGEIKRLEFAMRQLREEQKRQRETFQEKLQKLEKENRKFKDILSKIGT